METERTAEAQAQLEAACEQVFAFREIVEGTIRGLAGRLGQHPRIELTEDAAERSLARVYIEAGRTWEARKLVEEGLGVLNEDHLRALDSAIGVSQACLRLLEDRRAVELPHDVGYVISTLAVRALATCHEISALLRAGFPNGAVARWRTLHEVAVVASVLTVGNRHTATRFVNHRWIMAARDRDHQQSPPTWPDKRTPEVMRQRLVRHYGPEFSGKYGWAAVVTQRVAGVRSPQWHHLEAVAQLAEGHRQRVKRAHHSIHVDALGGLSMLDSSGMLHSGISTTGSHHVVWDTLRALAESTDSLIALHQRYDAAPTVLACRTYAARMLSELEFDHIRFAMT